MRARLAFLAAMTIVAGCGQPVEPVQPVQRSNRPPSARPPGKPSAKLNPVFGNPQAMNTVENATSVKAYRLIPEDPDFERQALGDYKISAGPYVLSNGLASELCAVLFDPSIYVWDYAKTCGPIDPGVRLQFELENDSVDVLLCFECDELIVFHNGKIVGGEDFDFGQPDLLAIVKDLFPGDGVIQSLTPKEPPPGIRRAAELD